MTYYSMIDESSIINDFVDLASIGAESRHERKIAEEIKNKFASLGIILNEDKSSNIVAGDCGNLYGTAEGSSELPSLFFCGHMDRVQPGNGAKTIVENGIIKSDGTTVLGADDLVAIVSVLNAFRTMKKAKILYPSVDLLFTVCEEIGLLGSKAFSPELIRANSGFIIDCTGPVGTVFTRGASQYQFKVKIKGKAAHAGIEPENGVSAIKVASEAIARIDIGRIDSDTTANIGTFSGGTVDNIVPENAEFSGEIRSLDDEKLDYYMDKTENLINEVCKKYNAEMVFAKEKMFWGYTIDPSSKLLNMVSKATDSIGLTMAVDASCGGSDVNILNRKGKETINLGAGYQKIHSCLECIKIEDIKKQTELVITLILLSN